MPFYFFCRIIPLTSAPSSLSFGQQEPTKKRRQRGTECSGNKTEAISLNVFCIPDNPNEQRFEIRAQMMKAPANKSSEMVFLQVVQLRIRKKTADAPNVK